MFLLIRILGALILLFGGKTQVLARDLVGLECGLDARGATLLYQNHLHTYQIVDFEFERFGWYDGDLACSRWIHSLSDDKVALFHEMNFIPYQTTSKKVVRMNQAAAEVLYQDCADSPNCKLRFPNNIFHLESPWTSIPETCDLTSDLPFGFKTKKFRKSENATQESSVLKDLEISEYWKTPDQNFTKILEKHSAIFKDNTALISTAFVSKGEIRKVRELAVKENATVYLVFDLENWISSYPEPQELSDLLDAAGDKVQLIPGFRTNRFSTGKHHIKGIVLTGKSPLAILSSANLTSNDSGHFSELGFVTHSRRVVDLWNANVHDKVREYCAKGRDFSCLTDMSFSRATNDVQSRLATTIERSCERFLSDPKFQPHDDSNAPPLDYQEASLDLIDNAQNSIDVLTHHLGNDEFLARLLRAQERGVKVSIGVGEFELLTDRNKNKFSALNIYPAKRGAMVNHSKFVILDGTTALWGTGNFTSTSFLNEREFAIQTTDQLFIKSLLHFAETWRRTDP